MERYAINLKFCLDTESCKTNVCLIDLNHALENLVGGFGAIVVVKVLLYSVI